MKLTDYALAFIGTNYLWSGDNPIEGFDCSGFICEVLRSSGVIGRQDYSSQGLYTLLKDKGFRSQLAPGSVLFFGRSTSKITHVAMALNEYQMIEAGGGDSTTTSVTHAAKTDAFVRVRLISSRLDLIACMKPEVPHE